MLSRTGMVWVIPKGPPPRINHLVFTRYRISMNVEVNARGIGTDPVSSSSSTGKMAVGVTCVGISPVSVITEKKQQRLGLALAWEPASQASAASACLRFFTSTRVVPSPLVRISTVSITCFMK